MHAPHSSELRRPVILALGHDPRCASVQTLDSRTQSRAPCAQQRKSSVQQCQAAASAGETSVAARDAVARETSCRRPRSWRGQRTRGGWRRRTRPAAVALRRPPPAARARGWARRSRSGHPARCYAVCATCLPAIAELGSACSAQVCWQTLRSCVFARGDAGACRTQLSTRVTGEEEPLLTNATAGAARSAASCCPGHGSLLRTGARAAAAACAVASLAARQLTWGDVHVSALVCGRFAACRPIPKRGRSGDNPWSADGD
jgi:hypothetical protein